MLCNILFCVREYLSNIGLVDAGIQRVVDMVDDFYGRDGRTAYVMSSDHGMTDWGSYCGTFIWLASLGGESSGLLFQG